MLNLLPWLLKSESSLELYLSLSLSTMLCMVNWLLINVYLVLMVYKFDYWWKTKKSITWKYTTTTTWGWFNSIYSSMVNYYIRFSCIKNACFAFQIWSAPIEWVNIHIYMRFQYAVKKLMKHFSVETEYNSICEKNICTCNCISSIFLSLLLSILEGYWNLSHHCN